jgi:hypothetical protein
MKIPLPRMPRWFDRYMDWINEPIWTRGRLELRRIDVVVAIGFFVCVAYYWWAAGFLSALAGGLLYIFLAMVALWML